MGMKLKSGADLCGFELTNFCIQGLESMPSDAALGRKYFHTNATDDVATGISLLNRERIYLGEGAWRATAYLDDIAAINEKLNLITGDTDTDTLINNLKDLEEFLKDFSETDKLKSLLDGKLDKSGGKINSTSEQPLILNSNKSQVRLLIQRNEENMSTLGWHTSYGTWMYDHASGHSLGIKIKDGTPFYNDGTFHTLIHSGNIGSYALKTDGSNGIANGKSINFYKADGVTAVSGMMMSASNNLLIGYGMLASGVTAVFGNSVQLNYGTSGNTGLILNSSGNVTIGGEDKAGTAAKLYVDGNISSTYVSFQKNNTEQGYIGLAASNNNIYISANNRLELNATNNIALAPVVGNVLIGTTTDLGSRLVIKHPKESIASTQEVLALDSEWSKWGYDYTTMAFFHNGDKKAKIGWNSAPRSAGSDVGLYLYNIKSEAMIVMPNEGGIYLDSDVHITGNLIVDGEVSAGGAGAEEGGSGSGSAEGVSEIFTPTSTSMAFDHNLGEDVIVQVYEKSGNVWNMVMVDTEITSPTKVTLRFGKIENTEHKVVIMGV